MHLIEKYQSNQRQNSMGAINTIHTSSCTNSPTEHGENNIRWRASSSSPGPLSEYPGKNNQASDIHFPGPELEMDHLCAPFLLSLLTNSIRPVTFFLFPSCHIYYD